MIMQPTNLAKGLLVFASMFGSFVGLFFLVLASRRLFEPEAISNEILRNCFEVVAFLTSLVVASFLACTCTIIKGISKQFSVFWVLLPCNVIVIVVSSFVIFREIALRLGSADVSAPSFITFLCVGSLVLFSWLVTKD